MRGLREQRRERIDQREAGEAPAQAKHLAGAAMRGEERSVAGQKLQKHHERGYASSGHARNEQRSGPDQSRRTGDDPRGDQSERLCDAERPQLGETLVAGPPGAKREGEPGDEDTERDQPTVREQVLDVKSSRNGLTEQEHHYERREGDRDDGDAGEGEYVRGVGVAAREHQRRIVTQCGDHADHHHQRDKDRRLAEHLRGEQAGNDRCARKRQYVREDRPAAHRRHAPREPRRALGHTQVRPGLSRSRRAIDGYLFRIRHNRDPAMCSSKSVLIRTVHTVFRKPKAPLSPLGACRFWRRDVGNGNWLRRGREPGAGLTGTLRDTGFDDQCAARPGDP